MLIHPHYEKKIADLQRRLDSQYDTIDETEHAIEEVKTQIFDLKKSSIFADSIYEFLLHFDEIYRECTDAEVHAILCGPYRTLSGAQERR